MKLYTGGGDKGETGLFGGQRLGKDHDRVSAYGTIDELNAYVGLAVSGCMDDQLQDILRMIQADLFALGSELAGLDPQTLVQRIDNESTERLESWIDLTCQELVPLKSFILPGGCELASRLHVCRTICRRAEREIIRLGRARNISNEITIYMNRLSDLFFAMARVANRRSGVGDVAWTPSRSEG